MSYYSKEVIDRVKKIDLLTYLQTCEPNELVREGRNYTTRSHDSLKINGRLWNWFSQGIGGNNALSYLMKVEGMNFKDAVKTLVESDITYVERNDNLDYKKEFILPPKNNNCYIARNYLIKRGISKNIIDYCISIGIIYQEYKKNNVVFIGKDDENIPKYAFVRGCSNKRYLHDAYGSDKAYSFRIILDENSKTVHFFESAIDLLSYLSIKQLEGKIPKDNYISMSGVSGSEHHSNTLYTPEPFINYMKKYKETNKIFIHFDNDEVGRNATESFKETLKYFKVEVIDEPSKSGKDFNDYLCEIKGINHKKKEEFER